MGWGVTGSVQVEIWSDVLLELLERAWADADPLAMVTGPATGQARTDDSCAV